MNTNDNSKSGIIVVGNADTPQPSTAVMVVEQPKPVATKSKKAGTAVHNAVGTGLSGIGKGAAWLAKRAYQNGLKPAGHFVTGIVIGDRNIEEEQKMLKKARYDRFVAAGLDPNSQQAKDLLK